MWLKGLTHFHTQFKYPGEFGIPPEELAEKLKSNGFDFCFCAGDHGDNEPSGRNAWGFLSEEYAEYIEFCDRVSDSGGAILFAAPETHLRFSEPEERRSEHHACLCFGNYLPSIPSDIFRDPSSMAIYRMAPVIDEFHRNGAVMVLNHPFLSTDIPVFNGPDPLKQDVLYKLDYFEMFTKDHPNHFEKDFAIYLEFMKNHVSLAMGCSGGVDRIDFPDDLAKVPATYLFVDKNIEREAIWEAWHSRKSYAVFGNLKIDEISPNPSVSMIKTDSRPQIALTASAFAGDDLEFIEIYRNGDLLEQIDAAGKKSFSLEWSDENPLPVRNSYIVHISSTAGELVTSPVHYEVKRSF